MKKISVVVPVYNVEDYLPQCLDSLVNQTLKDVEIIVVNDGSPDNSQKIIDEYAKRYPRKIKSLIKENGGQGSARNVGIDMASGEYIAFIDSDDWLSLDALEKLYACAKKNDSDIVICDMDDNYENGDVVYLNCTKYNSVYEVTPSASNKIFKKSCINKTRFLNKLWYEDFNFTTKILLSKPKISIISEALYHCNVRYNSTMNNNNSKKNLDMITIIDDIIKYANNNYLYDKNLFSYLIFQHVLITSINRVNNQNSIDKKNVLKELNNYCHNTIADFKTMPFYKDISFKRKIIANLNYIGLYRISKLLLAIKKKL